MRTQLANVAEILGSLYKANEQDADQGRRSVSQLLFFVDEQFGPEFCMLVTICVLKFGHLTTAKLKHGKLTVRSTAAFDEKFGFPFNVKMGRDETRWLFDYFDTPDSWPWEASGHQS
ncbi:MAG: hypothetical protein JWQ89_763 [Devosia sp.]|uniref:hypothetical protein n=1 Tax=Devosia sp. TaxID=1871048 RepID=UPI0026114337|nr:hypothetical protein [Devosia sp.]MDB5539036.1 hypothetical protein [Devosia sp.]